MCHFSSVLLVPFGPALHPSHVMWLSQLHYRCQKVHKARRSRYLSNHHSKGSSRKIQIMGHRGKEGKINKAVITAQDMKEHTTRTWIKRRQLEMETRNMAGQTFIQEEATLLQFKEVKWLTKGSKLSSNQQPH